MKRISILSSFIVAAALAATTTGAAAPLRGIDPHELDWTLPPGARIEGDRLIAEIPAEDGPRNIWCAAKIPVADALAAMKCVAAHVRFRAKGVSEPKEAWQGVKVQFMFDSPSGAGRIYRSVNTARGTYGWTNVTARISPLRDAAVKDGKATLCLGLEACTGRAEFDLSALRIEFEDVGLTPVNQDYIVRYPPDPQMTTAAEAANDGPRSARNDGHCGEAASSLPPQAASSLPPQAASSLPPQAASSLRGGAAPVIAAAKRPLRGCMLPARATTEDDIETLHQWGATMARFQIMRRFLSVNDNQDLSEYWAWVGKRLDNLEDVLAWAQARGMKICVDLHSFPGGVRAGDRDSNMLYDEKWAEAFVETWRRIAARCAPIVQTMGPVIYGYDLVNEPKQTSYAPISYWEIQRRAAEAIREIDPVTPIVVESNMAASPGAFRYLSPLAMDNVIYQIHFYGPMEFTHQGVASYARKQKGEIPFWPDPSKGWDRDYIRERLKAVRAFQEKHKCRIYVGEFSAVGYAPGADQWIRDAIAVFEEYGWDWTYHAFREWAGWDVEQEADDPAADHPDKFHRVPDSPRKRTLLDGFAK